jgi:hypothetical protein
VTLDWCCGIKLLDRYQCLLVVVCRGSSQGWTVRCLQPVQTVSALLSAISGLKRPPFSAFGNLSRSF